MHNSQSNSQYTGHAFEDMRPNPQAVRINSQDIILALQRLAIGSNAYNAGIKDAIALVKRLAK